MSIRFGVPESVSAQPFPDHDVGSNLLHDVKPNSPQES